MGLSTVGTTLTLACIGYSWKLRSNFIYICSWNVFNFHSTYLKTLKVLILTWALHLESTPVLWSWRTGKNKNMIIHKWLSHVQLTRFDSKASAECWSFALIQLWHLLLSKILAWNFLQGFLEPMLTLKKLSSNGEGQWKSYQKFYDFKTPVYSINYPWSFIPELLWLEQSLLLMHMC